MAQEGYVDYFSILGLNQDAKPGEVRKNYKRMMKNLVMDIAQAEITEERRAHFLLEMAKLNAAFYILRDMERRETYWREREDVMALERQWCEASEADAGGSHDELRRGYDSKLRHFLSVYVEEMVLAAGRDADCVEASHWDPAHERHASRLLRQYRQDLYQRILERLPFHQVTRPDIDWQERARLVGAILNDERGSACAV